jgi:nucleoside-diphosphate-sugar epimerase
MAPSTENLAVPLGFLVIVTGASGYVPSHTCDQLLSAGYRVRGTVRDSTKAAWVSQFFEDKYRKGRFAAVVVPAMEEPNAFDDVTHGAAGFIHMATWVTKFHDPTVAIPMSVQGALTALSVTAKERSIKRFVQTSSSTATTLPRPNEVFPIGSSDWNDEAAKKAWEPLPSEGPERLLNIYCAVKTQSE